MHIFNDISEAKKQALDIIKNPMLTHEQTVFSLAKLAENILPYPEGTPVEFTEFYSKGYICDVSEGHAPYAPRYILPDYEKFMREGSKHLRLDPPKTLYEATNALLIFYRSTPSVTHMPVYMGEIDTLLEPFIDDLNTATEIIRGFLIHCDRTFGSSFCHMNLSSNDTKSGRIILKLLSELQNAVPNFTILYDPNVTPDDYAVLAISAALESANPAFALKQKYLDDYNQQPFGIVSCYNGLPVAGGAYSLARIRLNKIADDSDSKEDFFNNKLPKVVDVFCEFMEAKIAFLVDETPFFEHNFLSTEGFIRKDNFVGLFGLVGLAECCNKLLSFEGIDGKFGENSRANEIGVEVLDKLQELVNKFKSNYGKEHNCRFKLHSQVGAENDEGTSPGVRIAIGEEIELYKHLKQAGLYHKYFPTGVGDIFPFDSTGVDNPEAILDIFKGAFKVGMRYISTYKQDGDLVRVTGYLVKRSDIQKHIEGKQLINDTNSGAYTTGEYELTLHRKVRSL